MQAATHSSVFEVRGCNTIHGFNYLGECNGDGKPWFAVGIYTGAKRGISDSELIDKVSSVSRVPKESLRIGGFSGSNYMATTHRSSIPACINALMLMGCRVVTQMGVRITYKPEDYPFSIEKSEKLALDLIRRLTLTSQGKVSLWFFELGGCKIVDERLWKTEEGKRWCRRAIEMEPHLVEECGLGKRLVIVDDPSQPFDPLIDWPEATEKCPAAAAAAAAALSNAVPLVSSPPEECMVCTERPADTMVLPCMHQVACRQCSKVLEKGLNSKLCILCRQPITHVMKDETPGSSQ